ncbi:hypothetical protein PAPYR_9119 [Paratrimastix pyriformis]|uniref:Uncharacterized protein n=1 Tax=Paratrimastix pyriformis TaxID=342808 RepID=A0ABQ8UEM9_9EUKA|nr:hypothetical protein PAPYR_9119 [Paratrimastix pyriformis]
MGRFAEPPSGRGWLAARDLPANMKMGWLREGQKLKLDHRGIFRGNCGFRTACIPSTLDPRPERRDI